MPRPGMIVRGDETVPSNYLMPDMVAPKLIFSNAISLGDCPTVEFPGWTDRPGRQL